jgi:hypothetical protein
LVDVLVSDLRIHYAVKREVSHYEKRIDVVAYCPIVQELTAIEAKSRDWQRALQQAMLNLTATDYSYIAIWSESAHRVCLGLLDEFGIGLIVVGTSWGSVDRVVEARRSRFTNRFVRAHLGEQFGAEVVA